MPLVGVHVGRCEKCVGVQARQGARRAWGMAGLAKRNVVHSPHGFLAQTDQSVVCLTDAGSEKDSD